MKKTLAILLAVCLVIGLTTTAFASVSVTPTSITPGSSTTTINNVLLKVGGSATFRISMSAAGDYFELPTCNGNFSLTPFLVSANAVAYVDGGAVKGYYADSANAYVDFTVSVNPIGTAPVKENYLIMWKTGTVTSQYTPTGSAFTTALSTVNDNRTALAINAAPVYGEAVATAMKSYAAAGFSAFTLNVKHPTTTNSTTVKVLNAGTDATDKSTAGTGYATNIAGQTWETALAYSLVSISETEYNALPATTTVSAVNTTAGTADTALATAAGNGTGTKWEQTITVGKDAYAKTTAPGALTTQPNIVLTYAAADAATGNISAEMIVAVAQALQLNKSTVEIDERTGYTTTVNLNKADFEAAWGLAVLNSGNEWNAAGTTLSVKGHNTYKLTAADYNYFIKNNPIGKDFLVKLDEGEWRVADLAMGYDIGTSEYVFSVTVGAPKLNGASAEFTWTRVARVSTDNNRPYVFNLGTAINKFPADLNLYVYPSWVGAYGHSNLNLYEFVVKSICNHTDCAILSHYDDTATLIQSGLKLPDTRETRLVVKIPVTTGSRVYFLSNKLIGGGTVSSDNKDANPNTGANDVVSVAVAFAVVSLAAAGAFAFKKASK